MNASVPARIENTRSVARELTLLSALHVPHMRLALSTPARSSSFILGHELPGPLRVYYDGAVIGESLPHAMAARAGVTWIELSRAQPWAAAAAASMMQHDSAVQAAYRSGKMHCIVGRAFRSTRVCKDPLTVYKIGAMYDVATRRIGSHALWLDSDAYFQRALDKSVLSWLYQFDVATIFRRPQPPRIVHAFPDTGILYFDVDGARLLLHRARATYENSSLQALCGGVNDVQVLSFHMRALAERGLRVGRFAVGCRPAAPPLPRWAADAQGYDNLESWVDCPSRSISPHGNSNDTFQTPSISPFNLFAFVTHAKSHGPMVAGAAGPSPHNPVRHRSERRCGRKCRNARQHDGDSM